MTTEIINPETDEKMFISYIDKIRKEVECAADNWLHIAYYVYELNYFGYYKKHFDNIVDCCQANFGFKKSTTYNFINIVEQFADNVGMVKSKPKLQYVGFNDFFNAVRQWSYSQLVAMLSLSDKQREQATPEMSAREIKRLKTDSKRLENNSAESSETAPAEIVIDESASPAPAEVVESEPAAPAPAAAPAAPAAAGSVPVNAPMPGTILDIKVKAGAAVKAGDVVMILEAMKMENEISAPQDGTIASIDVRKGDTVNSGDVLYTMG